MALKKTDLYSSLWKSCDELRGGMDAGQYKDYILTLLFVKYVSDKAKADPDSLIDVPPGGSFDDMVAAKGDKEIGDRFNKIIYKLAEANDLRNVIDLANFNDDEKLGKGKEIQDRLSKLVAIFSDLDFRGSRAEGDDLLGDAYEYLMRHFATESGKSKGQFYTPAEVSRVLAKVVGITRDTRQDQTVYDPTCGSGSLLLKVAAETSRGISIYGQEKDNATWALSKMNMILHGNEDAEILKGDTITSPQFTSGNALQTFDFAVANPPFSIKSWSNGLELEYGRFEYGRPPEKNGDYAFLLHILKSLKSTGKAAVILPHGVLSRPHAEAEIRRRLLKQGFIKGIIGLPSNLFYGTSIPACIIVLDKENAVGRTGVFMIDASKGFIKDGNKNRLRSQDIHKIVDVFTRQTAIERYSRMVPLSEIADPKNDYNLNITRYIDSSEPEDIQDLHAHLHGGIPDHDLDALSGYWDAFPQLRGQLFQLNRPGYSDLTIEVSQVQQAILDSPEFQRFTSEARELATEWFAAHRKRLEEIDETTRPNDLIAALGDDLLTRFKPVPLLDEYDVYEQLMTYWHDVVHDDVFMVMNDGWLEAAKPRKIVVDRDRNLSETPDLVVGAGRSAAKYKMDLIPPDLIVTRYFAKERTEVDELVSAWEEASRAVEEYVEEHAVEDGLLAEAMDDEKINKVFASARLKKARYEGADADEVAALSHLIKLYNAESVAKKAAKEAQEALRVATLKKYGDLTEVDVKTLVLDDKWYETVASRITSEVTALTFALVARIQELGARYAETVAELNARLEKLEAEISGSLKKMGLQGSTRQLLTGETRLPGFFSGEWTSRPLREGVSLISGNHVMAKDCNTQGIGTPYLTGPADFPDGRIKQTKFTTRPAVLCKAGDILITVKGSGSGSMVEADAEYCISRQLMAVRPSSGWDARFLFYSLWCNASQIKAASTGLIPGLSRSDILDQKLPIPPTVAEQRAVAAVLSAVDLQVDNLESLISKKEEIKQGMMQELLTGRTRLPAQGETEA